MEKKTYITPSMELITITSTHMLCGSGGENNLRMFRTQDIQDANVENEISQW